MPRNPGDKSVLLQSENHLMYRWWCYSKVLLHVGLGRRPTVDLRVVIDKGQVLALFLSKLHDALKQNDEI